MMNKQEKNLFKAFEEAMQKAMKAYLSSKDGHIENGLGEKYAVTPPYLRRAGNFHERCAYDKHALKIP